HTWSRAYEERIFAYDAFLSHRWGDEQALQLKHELDTAGVFVWHDEYYDLSNQEAASKVTRALFHSRYVVVCVGKFDMTTSWIQAECMPALSCEKTVSACRVVVAITDPQAQVPAFLSECIQFVCYDASETGVSLSAVLPLAEYLLKGNMLPFSLKKLALSGPLLSVEEQNALFRDVNEILSPHDQRYRQRQIPASEEADEHTLSTFIIDIYEEYLNAATPALIASCLRDVQHSDRMVAKMLHPQWLGMIRQQIKENVNIFCEHRDIAKFLCSAALFLADCTDSDQRANASMILTAFANGSNADVKEFAEALLTRYLRWETDEALLQLALLWIQLNYKSMSDAAKQIACLVAIQCPRALEVGDSYIIADMPEVIRVRIFLKCVLSKPHLGIDEQLKLITRRITYICQMPIDNKTAYEVDLEVVIRELWACAFPGIPSPGIDDLDSYALLLDMPSEIFTQFIESFQFIVSSSEKNRGQPLVFLGLFLFDWFLVPLLYFLNIPIYREAAIHTYNSACSIIDEWSEYNREVGLYRDVLSAREHGRSARELQMQIIQSFSALRRTAAFEELFDRGLIEPWGDSASDAGQGAQ
ncbi:MAG: hypothetical protein JWQ02_1253, partial [Capsulimonas sp.]|nr:hypothetical protein [Capsulimonas sp.]